MELLSTSHWNRRYSASSRRHFSAGSRPTGSRCVQPARSGAPSFARRVNTLPRPPARPAEVSSAYTHTHISGASCLSPAVTKPCSCCRRWSSGCTRPQRRPDCPQRARPDGSTAALLPWWLIRSATLTPTISFTLSCVPVTEVFVFYFLGLGGLQVTKEQKEEQFHFLVFTDVFGNKTHGVVMQCHRPVQVHAAARRTVLHFCWRPRTVSADHYTFQYTLKTK